MPQDWAKDSTAPPSRLSSAQLRLLRLPHLAMVAGVLLFFGVVLLIHFGQRRPAAPLPGSVAIANTMTIVNVALVVVCYTLAPLLKSRMLRSRRAHHLARRSRMALASIGASEDLVAVRAALILRAALLEAPALVGLVTCLQASTQGVLGTKPIYWLNAGSALLFVVAILLTLPSAESVEEMLRERSVRN